MAKEMVSDAGPVYDAHVHLWSNGEGEYAGMWKDGRFPPPGLTDVGATENYLRLAKEAGVAGALIVHHNHGWAENDPAGGFTHKYVTRALADHPTFFKGMAVIDPSLGGPDGCAMIRRLQAQGFSSVRFNPNVFPDGLCSLVAKQLYRCCGELGMPVGFMLPMGLQHYVRDLLELMEFYPSTTAIIDHMGFFRQAGLDQAASWDSLLRLAKHDRVYVKVSAFLRLGDEGYPAMGLAPRVRALVDTFGAHRVMFGSDFPYAMYGSPMKPGLPASGHSPTAVGTTYADIVKSVEAWGVLTPEELSMVMGGTLASLFW